jgi:hypothetical protein
MADYSTWTPQEFGKKYVPYGEGGYPQETAGVTYYQDPTTGNYYDVPFAQRGYWSHPDDPLPLDFANAKLVASGEAINDPFIKSLYQNDPLKAQELYQQKVNDPKAFYGQIAKDLENDIFGNWQNNWSYGGLDDVKNRFNELKDVAPDVYYENLLTTKAKQIGWNYGQNGPENAKIYEEQLRNEIPNALKAGLSQEQINNIINSKVNEGAQLGQTLAANAASGGNFWNQNLMGALKIGAFALGAGGLDAALGAGAATTPNAYMASAGLNPGVFEGAAFTMPSSLGAASGVASELAGPTYQELGYTGLEAGQMGPTYGELGYTGLNNAQAIAAADAASKGLTLADVLSGANKARQGLGLASGIAKMVGGGNSGSQNARTSGGTDLGGLVNALRGQNTFNPINLQQIQPKNPFFGSTQGTLGGEDIYDVSGSNLANALRKR